MKPNILVTGGAGYIGSHTVQLLLDGGYDVTVVDDLSCGHRHNVQASRLHIINMHETGALTALLEDRKIDAVIHFAAFIQVGESMKNPEKYFANNTGGSLSLLTAMVSVGVKALVFSSTAAVYGIPHTSPIEETFPIQPVNAYGESKVLVERMLRWFDQLHGLRSVVLRYFNACGCDPAGRFGEEHVPESHLIPLILRAVQTGQPITVFGDDYATPDGTCIRDYIHVNDLAAAHILAVDSLLGGGATNQFNVGTGRGYSVREVIAAVEEVTGQKVPVEMGPRREGDPPNLVASSEKLRQTLGWAPRYTDIRDVIRHAWNFQQKRKQ